MVGDHHRNARLPKRIAASPHLTDGGGGGEQVLGRDAPHRQDDPGLDERDLAQQEGFAGLGLGGGRVPVIGRSAFQDIGDVDLVPAETDGLEHGIQQPSRAPHEGFALAVLIGSRRLADEHPVGGPGPHAEHGLGAGLAKLAGRAGRYLGGQFLPRRCRGGIALGRVGCLVGRRAVGQLEGLLGVGGRCDRKRGDGLGDGGRLP